MTTTENSPSVEQVRHAWGQIRAVGTRVAWYFTALMGDDAYRKYREHYESVHQNDINQSNAHDHGSDADAPPMMTEREFWRDQTDRQDAHPQGRCC
jgi:uncharacterized short protein YbdD (DUF466 family)